jgi:hypothetical protein
MLAMVVRNRSTLNWPDLGDQICESKVNGRRYSSRIRIRFSQQLLSMIHARIALWMLSFSFMEAQPFRFRTIFLESPTVRPQHNVPRHSPK